MTSTASGRIITFYSYKGGTGRSMALANVAWILAANGHRVLVLDWDLEAPGLHRYFRPFLADPELTSSEGIIDFVNDYAAQAVLPATGDEPTDEGWYLPHADLSPYSLSLECRFLSGGIDLVPAGRQGRSYAERVNSFGWSNFFERLGGAALLREVRERLLREGHYDYVLIDSRTGVSDTAGICTVEMPDDLVVCFTLNHQSIEGAAAVARSVREQRPDVRVYPVPMRIDLAEKEKLEARRQHARSRFALFPDHLDGELRAAYWREVQVLYWPFYAYEEVLAVFGDLAGSSDSLLAKFQLLTSYLTEGRVTSYPGLPEVERQRVLALYGGREPVAAPRGDVVLAAETVFHRLDAADQEQARRLFTQLLDVSPDGRPVGRREVVEVDRLRVPTAILQAFVEAGVLDLIRQRPTGIEAVRFAAEEVVEWPRLLRWADEDRDFLVWQGRLRRKREAGDEPLAATDPVVEHADRWRRRASAELPPDDVQFLAQSLDEVRRRRARRLLAATVAAVTALLSVVWALQSISKVRDVETAAALVALGEDLVARGETSEAVAAYREAVALAPASLPARIGLMNALAASGDGPAALAVSEAVLDDPHFESSDAAQRVQVLRTRANLEWLNGDVEEAAEYLRGAVAVAPERPELHHELAELLEAADEPTSAILAYSREIELAPASVDAYFARGALFQRLGRREDAVRDFRAVLGLSPTPNDREAACVRLASLQESCPQEQGEPQTESARIFVHHQPGPDEEVAEEVRSFLEAQGFPVAGLEASRAPTRGDIRYFFAEDRSAALAVAQAVSSALAKSGHRVMPELRALDAKEYPRARPGLIEVWLPTIRSAAPRLLQ